MEKQFAPSSLGASSFSLNGRLALNALVEVNSRIFIIYCLVRCVDRPVKHQGMSAAQAGLRGNSTLHCLMLLAHSSLLTLWRLRGGGVSRPPLSRL